VGPESTVILLVGKPGHLRDALQSLIGILPGLNSLKTADTGLLALKILKETQPSLALIGSGLPDAEVLELVRQIKQEQPQTHCLVLTEQSGQRHLALAAGADRVISPGSPAGEVVFTIEQMLNNRP
jgi:DNA-binding NarL/FixJ family response regulator